MKYQVEMPEYNTDRGFMQISEYGRNIQKMVEVAVAESDRNKRNRLAGALIQLMGMLNPHLRDVADYKHKLWDHLFVISDFKLDVDSPYPIPTRESIASKPALMKYPQRRIRYRFYGKNIEQMIERAANMEEGPSKGGFINLIGSFMKQACKSWNEEQLSDEEILHHLELLSDGRIKLNNQEDVQFNALQNQHRSNNRNYRTNQSGGQNNRNFRPGQGSNQPNRNRNNNQSNTGGQNRNNPNNPNTGSNNNNRFRNNNNSNNNNPNNKNRG
ncbi:MAG: DUF4290 domain-containing protein [Bacteroidia bacterium]|nr:DUF4290 domain-containing protein [Bacteroidia bacterium]MBP9689702.1 DUF4290 domain-containing protein [Bacteroidia bacterium]